MFGFYYIKFDSMRYVLHYSGGKLRREGKGLAFLYFAPSSSIAAIPVGSMDVPFIFNESTADFQTVSIQGQITYKVENPKLLAEQLDYTVDRKGVYKTDDFAKLSQRLINEAQTYTTAYVQQLNLKEALRKAKEVEAQIAEGLRQSAVVAQLGVSLVSLNVLAISPTPEMARALEAEAREAVQQEADQAVYLRRNFAVEQERKIRESELNTEIAVEEKKRQIQEKQRETRIAQVEAERQVLEMQMETQVSVENRKRKLVDLAADNRRKEADTQRYVLENTLAPYQHLDWKTVLALSEKGGSPALNIALAFRELAQQNGKIGSLNISPDLLDSLMQAGQDGN
ncbi:MAG: membrane protease subunit, stomatin/prohibitin [Bacteroidetes bacterium]|nr:membrane protease subunit, stomatin/prohibitin [Bacteroidota bacterium]